MARNHELQEQALHAYQIYPDLFAGSGLAPAKDVHEQVSDWFIRTLYQHGWIEKRSTAQFYDVEAGQFLNGRQVQGYCPRARLQVREGLRRRVRPGAPV